MLICNKNNTFLKWLQELFEGKRGIKPPVHVFRNTVFTCRKAVINYYLVKPGKRLTRERR
ncbi:hypothetical protein DXA96_19330 [Lachnospiraceae bacterium OF09-33XD]|nr:hypothetical protein DXA96_19330 [Lachnospiraceae bacterium OF09-33XD]